MTRLRTLLILPLLLTACGTPDYSSTPEGRCLMSAGYESLDGRSFLREDTRVTLAEFDGVVQPVGTSDLNAYVAAGCR